MSAGLVGGLLSSVLVGLSQIHFFSSWVCLELNMLMFVALMSVFEKSVPSASMKYFIIQSVGSSVYLWSTGLEGAGLGLVSEMGMVSALSLKLGIAPFQSWFVSVLAALGWELVFLASTLQKMLPIFLLSMMKFEGLSLYAGLSLVVSILGSINQTFLKKILAYSSIFMTVWLMSCEGELAKSLEYLFAYSDALGVVVLIFGSLVAEDISEVLNSGSSVLSPLLMSGFLSMGGCPPFIGFYAKISVILSMLNHNQMMWGVLLTLVSVFFLFIYMRMFYFSLSLSNNQWGASNVSRSGASLLLGLGGVLLLPGIYMFGCHAQKVLNFQDLSNFNMHK